MYNYEYTTVVHYMYISVQQCFVYSYCCILMYVHVLDYCCILMYMYWTIINSSIHVHEYTCYVHGTMDEKRSLNTLETWAH